MSSASTYKTTTAPHRRSTPKPKEFTPTAANIQALREALSLSKAAFAREVGVSPASINNWEKKTGTLNIHPDSLKKLKRLYESKEQ
ncbi:MULTISPECIES: DNA-binding transcriptional regulator [unclassified Lentimonas]|nr:MULTISPECIES: helix-turn-helix transcriptional regulator [unclassified Lentimonas]CAA6694125.1 Unannotated [Lentimonas sp. CC19]CAA6694379.1 Unannotated [Lentimonas sp. CC10]CAA7070355.1 Unannotated [Lentimonas sp. CC11]